MIFNGRNNLPGIPVTLEKIVSILLKHEAEGKFVYSCVLSDWDNFDDVMDALGLRYDEETYYYAVGLAYVVSHSEASVKFPQSAYCWSVALKILSPFAGWDSELIAKVVKGFSISEEVECNIRDALRGFAKTSFSVGNKLLSLLPEFSVSVKIGLMENDFQRYCEQYPPERDSEDFQNAAIVYYLSSLSGLDGEKKTICENQIVELLNGGAANLMSPVCDWIAIQSETTAFIEDCILLLIKGLPKEFDEACIKKLDRSIVGNHLTINLMKKITIGLVEFHESLAVINMERSIRKLSKNKTDFIEFVLFLIINPSGLCRMIGRYLWDHYSMETSEWDVFELDGNTQIIFAQFMLEDFGNPEHRIPKLLPLLGSESRRIRQVFLNILKPYIDDYMGHVISELDKLHIETEESKLLRDYFDRRSEFLQARRNLKELSPQVTEYKSYSEALRCEKRHMKALLAEAESNYKSDWMGLFPKVMLARGGGWREKDGSSRPLAEIKCSLPARQMLQSMCPIEYDEWMKKILQNYDTEGDN